MHIYIFFGFLDHPLAKDFDIMDGQHTVTVPILPVGDDYQLIRKSTAHSYTIHTPESNKNMKQSLAIQETRDLRFRSRPLPVNLPLKMRLL